LLVDTTYIIDIMLNDKAAIRKAQELDDTSTPLIVGAPTIFELYIGVGLSMKPQEEKWKIIDILRSLTHMPLDNMSASRAGFIYAERTRQGRKIDPEDAMLAGIAIENHQPLLTRNIRDFAGMSELKVESY
jgi:predicted nucleic acid-binding protein